MIHGKYISNSPQPQSVREQVTRTVRSGLPCMKWIEQADSWTITCTYSFGIQHFPTTSTHPHVHTPITNLHIYTQLLHNLEHAFAVHSSASSSSSVVGGIYNGDFHLRYELHSNLVPPSSVTGEIAEISDAHNHSSPNMYIDALCNVHIQHGAVVFTYAVDPH